MRPGLDQRLVELFEKALELEPGQRTAFLAQACADSVARAEVESLLAHHESGEADSFLEEPAPLTIPGARAGARAPTCFGRYRVTQTLGTGGFGVVYQGYDEDLRRMVAIKVPHRARVAQPEDVQAYLTEARIVAGLDHAHIVPVYDVGHTSDGLC